MLDLRDEAERRTGDESRYGDSPRLGPDTKQTLVAPAGPVGPDWRNFDGSEKMLDVLLRRIVVSESLIWRKEFEVINSVGGFAHRKLDGSFSPAQW
jgi:hypothetical protein